MPSPRAPAAAVVAALALLACNALTGAADFRADSRAAKTPQGDDDDDDDAEVRPSRRDSGNDIPSSSLDAGFEASDNPITFSDNFDRGNNAAIGNGWIEKTDVFSVNGNTLLQSNIGSYADLLIRRPTTENVANVELAVDFTYPADPDLFVDPTLFARQQPLSDQAGKLQGYAAYCYRDELGIGRDVGTPEEGSLLASVTINPPLNIGETYHMVFRVTGTNPVQLAASITKLDGTMMGTVATSDVAPTRIEVAGQVGIGSADANGGRWDNFSKKDL